MQAEDEINQLLSAHIATVKEELSLAELLLADGQDNAAAEVLRDAAATWPDTAEAHGDLGLLLMRRQQYEAAVSELGRAAQLDPSSAKYSLGLGEALLRWRHDTIALQYLVAVQDRFQQFPLYEFRAGSLLLLLDAVRRRPAKIRERGPRTRRSRVRLSIFWEEPIRPWVNWIKQSNASERRLLSRLMSRSTIWFSPHFSRKSIRRISRSLSGSQRKG